MAQAPLADVIETGLWPRVRAQVRALTREEMPPAGTLDDGRLVTYYLPDSQRPRLDTTGLSPYTPLQDPELLSELIRTFARDEAPSEAEVVAFYAGYGPLGGWEVAVGRWYPKWASRLDAERPDRVLRDGRLVYSEPLWWVREQARAVQLAYRCYAGLRDSRVGALRSLVGEVPQGKHLVGLHISGGRLLRDVRDGPAEEAAEEGLSESARRSVELVRADSRARDLAARLLASQLTLAEQRAGWHWVARAIEAQLDRRDRPAGTRRGGTLEVVRVRRVATLVTAAYLQLGELVHQQAALRQCLGCGGLFFPRRTNHRYCTARCGDAARQRDYYRRRPTPPKAPRSK